MFERFTTQAREVVVAAQAQSRQLNHRYIGTEHLLLALITVGPGIASTVLADAGLEVGRVTAEIERLVGSPTLSDSDAEALGAIGIDLNAVRAKLEESFGVGALDHDRESEQRGLFRRRSGRGHIPFTARAKKVLELSLREAIHMRSNSIGAEHILLGLLREGEGLAAKVITGFGVSLADLRAQTLAAMRQAA